MPVSAITSEMLHSKKHLLGPYPIWKHMRHDKPVFFDDITKTWLLTQYTDCIEAFTNDDLHLRNERKIGHHGTEGRYGHLGFGLRKHFYLGYEMAQLEAVIGSSHLSNFMKNQRLTEGADTTFITKNATRSPLKVLIEYERP